MEAEVSNTTRRNFLVLSCVLQAIGYCGGPLIMRLYYVYGGNNIWLLSTLETGGWPVIFIPLILSYFHRRKFEGSNTKLVLVTLPTFIAAAAIGLIGGIANYSYAFGVARLPVSTSTLIAASQLAFTALFAFIIVKQKFNSYSINAIVLLTIGMGVLALHASSDIPKGESKRLYILGFVLTIASAFLNGLIFPLIELTYKKAKQTITYTLVMEIQMVVCFSATAFSIVGMAISNDFKVIPREAKEYQLGEAKYYLILFSSAITWQFFLLGAIGVVFSASALVTCILASVLLPISEVLAVIFFHDKFEGEKGIALALSLWGFVSYFYGEIKHSRTQVQIQETENYVERGDGGNFRDREFETPLIPSLGTTSNTY